MFCEKLFGAAFVTARLLGATNRSCLRWRMRFTQLCASAYPELDESIERVAKIVLARKSAIRAHPSDRTEEARRIDLRKLRCD